MSTSVVCPNCKTQFEPTAAIAQSVRDEMAREFNQKWQEKSKQKDEQFRQQEQQLQQQLQEQARKAEDEKKALAAQLKKELEQQVGADFENKLKLAEEKAQNTQARLNEAREKEMEFLRKEQDMLAKVQEAELAAQRRLAEERSKLAEQIKKEEEEKNRLRDTEHQMKVAELQKQLEDQRKLAEEMRRKAEQGSMQLQGEVQELALEEMLKYAFPFDLVKEVGKGVRGADCVMTVRNNFGQECGRIIFESKRTKDFSEEWVEKLKADMRMLQADVAVIVTQAMPKDMECFGERNGVWVCSFGEARALVNVLRDLVVKVYTANKSQEGKGDKMTLLYNYFTSSEFSEQWKAIREGFMGMKMSIQRERDQMEKMWKAREKQLDKVLLNAAHFKGAIEGIAGMDVDLNLLGEESGMLLE